MPFDNLLVEDLPVNRGVVEALRGNDITTVGTLRRLTPRELARLEGLPAGGVGQIRDALLSCGLELGQADGDGGAETPAGGARQGRLEWARVRFGAWCIGAGAVLALAAEELVELTG